MKKYKFAAYVSKYELFSYFFNIIQQAHLIVTDSL
jgi:hypothetical protein